MYAAWTAKTNGSNMVVLPEYQPHEHHLFTQRVGQEKLLPIVDGFLRERGLPTWSYDNELVALQNHLSPRQQKELDRFLAEGGSMKAMAVPAVLSDQSYPMTGVRTLSAARTKALAQCEEESGKNCIIVVDNFSATGVFPKSIP